MKLALLGFGTVGQGLAEIIDRKRESIHKETGVNLDIVAISDVMKGAIYNPNGLNVTKTLEAIKTGGHLSYYPDEKNLVRGKDSFATIEETNADVIVEVTYTDVKTGQPAIDHCKTAFQCGKHVVLSNKGPVALAFQSLTELAQKHNVRFGIEGTVMSGTPALRMPLTSLIGNDITEIRGILNGTTNYILTKMEEGFPFEDALKDAQEKGYAEADSTSDIKGYDAKYKVVILANTVLGVPLQVDDVECIGIDTLTMEDIQQAKKEGYHWKLLGKITKHKSGVEATVKPEKISENDPLASVYGAVNAIQFDCDLAGPITLTGAGAGRLETGYSLLVDILNIARNQL